MSVVDGAIWGFIGVVIGAIITGFWTVRAESVRADKAAALDTAKREDDRRIDRDNFQRETLLALQDALAAFLRAHGKAHFADVMTLRKLGHLTQYPEGVSDEMFETNRRLSFLVERVTDDELRASISHLRSESARVEAHRAVDHAGVTEARLDAELLQLVQTGDAAGDRLGVVLRGYL